MRNVNGGFALDKIVELLINPMLCHGVECGGRLVEHDHGRVLVKCARQRDFLRLAARNFYAVFIHVFVKRGIFLLRHTLHAFERVGFGKALL